MFCFRDIVYKYNKFDQDWFRSSINYDDGDDGELSENDIHILRVYNFASHFHSFARLIVWDFFEI